MASPGGRWQLARSSKATTSSSFFISSSTATPPTARCTPSALRLDCYGFAWTGHFVLEKNKPATFGYPFWSFISDFRMLWLMATGQLSKWMAKGVATAS
jgi:hypothetical protein